MVGATVRVDTGVADAARADAEAAMRPAGALGPEMADAVPAPEAFAAITLPAASTTVSASTADSGQVRGVTE